MKGKNSLETRLDTAALGTRIGLVTGSTIGYLADDMVTGTMLGTFLGNQIGHFYSTPKFTSSDRARDAYGVRNLGMALGAVTGVVSYLIDPEYALTITKNPVLDMCAGTLIGQAINEVRNFYSKDTGNIYSELQSGSNNNLNRTFFE